MASLFGPGRFYGTLQAEHRLTDLRVAHLAGTTPEHEVAEHGHDDAHFVLATHGRYLTAAHGEASEGPVLVFNPPGVVHRDRFAGDGGWFLAVSVPAERWRDLADRATRDAVRLARPQAVRRALRLARAAVSTTPDPLHIEALALELAAEAETRSSALAYRPAWLDTAEQFIADNRAAPISVADIAEAADVHPVYLARAFRRWTGGSPGDRLRARRLERAAELLALPGLGIGDIALRAGFCDQSHLNRVFRRLWGVTPGEYRGLKGVQAEVSSVQDGGSRSG